MNLIESIKKLFGIRPNDKEAEVCFSDLVAEVYYKKLAVETCISLIANALAICEFQTFENGKEVKKENYYLFNVRPNVNFSAGEFWHRFVTKLVKENEALIIMQNDQIFVADSYTVDEFALVENIYSNVTIGAFVFQKKFSENEVLHIRLNNENVIKIIDSLYRSYGKLLESAQNIYKRKNAIRVVVEEETGLPQDEESLADRQNLYESEFKTWFEADKAGAVLPLPKGLTLKDWSESSRSNTTLTSRDIRSLVDDIFDFTATALHVPVNLIRGDLADIDNQVNSFLMFCVKPIAKLLKDEINAKMYTKAQYLEKTRAGINTSNIKIIDIVKLATAADKLFACGVNSINDNLKMLEKEEVSEEWADEKFISKNYQRAEIFMKEGESDGNVQNKETAGSKDQSE